MSSLTTSFESLKGNYRFHYILEVSLAIGNYLNGTSFKGGAWGFKLESLERMADVKSKDNKMNAFFYVIRKVWEKYQYPLFDREELELYQYTEKYPVSQINVELG